MFLTNPAICRCRIPVNVDFGRYLLAAGPCRIVISACRDRRFFVWAKWGGVSNTDTHGPTTFRSGRTFRRVATPGSVPLLTSHNSKIHFTKRHGDFFSRFCLNAYS